MIVESVNTLKLVTRVLPDYLRNDFIISYIKAHVDACNSTFEDFLTLRASKIKEARYNSQTIVLDAILNELVTGSENSIYIENLKVAIPLTVIFQESELQADTIIYTESEAMPNPVEIFQEIEGSVLYSFIVHCPIGANQDQIKAIVNKYKIAGTKYIIQTF